MCSRRRPGSSGRLLAVALAGALLAMGAAPAAAETATGPSAADLRGYVAEVEPIRDGVNRLLDTADPLLER